MGGGGGGTCYFLSSLSQIPSPACCVIGYVALSLHTSVGFFVDLLSLVWQNFTMMDMVLLLHGQHQPLSRIQPQLSQFFTEHYLRGREPTDANISVSTTLDPRDMRRAEPWCYCDLTHTQQFSQHNMVYTQHKTVYSFTGTLCTQHYKQTVSY